MGQIPSMMKQEFIETLRTNPVKLTINEKNDKNENNEKNEKNEKNDKNDIGRQMTMTG